MPESRGSWYAHSRLAQRLSYLSSIPTMEDPDADATASLLLQFSMKGISARNELTKTIYNSITSVVSCEKIKAVQINPSEKWPQNVVIQCADSESKTLLLQNGIVLYGNPVELAEGGTGTEKVSIKGAPLDFPNHVIIKELRKFGEYISIRPKPFYAGREKTEWSNGTRIAYLRNVKKALPPTIMCEFNGFQRKVSISHDGQTLFECRWCKEHILRTEKHECQKKTVRACFNCKATDHVQADCPHPLTCHECSSTGHIAKNCPRRLKGGQQDARSKPGSGATKGPRPFFTLGEVPLAPPRNRSKKRRINVSGSEEMPTLEEEGAVSNSTPTNIGARDRTYSNRESLNASIQKQANDDLFEKGSVNLVAIGTSNFHELPLHGDDALELNVDMVVQGGLKITEASDKLSSDIPPAKLLGMTAVILHVGGPDFPVEDNADIERHYVNYVDTAVDVSLKCPNARLYLSGILPRKGSLRSKENRDIMRMNKKIRGLGNDEERMTYVNNDCFLTDGQNTLPELYSDKEGDDIHLSRQGKVQLASYLLDFIKNDYYQAKMNSVSAESRL